MLPHPHSRRWRPRWPIVAVIGALGLAVGLGLPGRLPLRSAQLPAGPMIIYQSAFDVTDHPSAFSARTALVEFAPGAFIPPHYHDAMIFGLVVEGEVTRTVGGVTTVYRVGESWVGTPGEVHEYEGNPGPVPARFISTTLVPPGGRGLILLPPPAP